VIVDNVAVLRSANFAPVFDASRTIKAKIGRDSKAMEHPIETGAVVTDHRIILPVAIELSILATGAEFKTLHQQIEALFLSGELLIVQTRVASYQSMLIEKMPHEESADVYDGVTIAVALKQAQFVTPQYAEAKVSYSKDSNTVPRGQVQATEAPAQRRTSIIAGWFK